MTQPRIHGHTQSGNAITDKDVEELAAEAEAGYDVDALIARRNKRGRPALGAAPASVESVRLDPELRGQLLARAHTEGTTPPMRTEAASAGFYQSPPWGNHPKIQLVTVGQLLAGHKLDMPAGGRT